MTDILKKIRLLAIACVIPLCACSDPGGLEFGRIELRVDGEAEAILVEGQTLTLVAEVYDGSGNLVSSGNVDWESDDLSTVTVDNGVLTGVAPGICTVTATFGTIEESIAVIVRFSDLGGGGTAFRVSGVSGERGNLDATSVLFEHHALHSPTPSTYTFIRARSWLSSDSSAGQPTGTDPRAGLSLLIEEALTVGTYEIPGVQIPEQGANTSELLEELWFGIRLTTREEWIGEWEYLEHLYLPVEPFDLVIEEFELPPDNSGLPEGRIRGRVAFEAAGLIWRWTRESRDVGYTPEIIGQLGGETVLVYAEFDAPVYWSKNGDAHFSLDGGPFLRDSNQHWETVHSRMDGQGVMIEYWVDFEGIEYPGRNIIHLRIPNPAIGSSSFGQPGLDVLTGGAIDLPWVGIAVDFHLSEDRSRWVEPYAVALSEEGGSLIIEDYVPGTDTHYGFIRGSLSTTVNYASGATGSTLITGEFVLPIEPTSDDVSDAWHGWDFHFPGWPFREP